MNRKQFLYAGLAFLAIGIIIFSSSGFNSSSITSTTTNSLGQTTTICSGHVCGTALSTIQIEGYQISSVILAAILLGTGAALIYRSQKR